MKLKEKDRLTWAVEYKQCLYKPPERTDSIDGITDPDLHPENSITRVFESTAPAMQSPYRDMMIACILRGVQSMRNF